MKGITVERRGQLQYIQFNSFNETGKISHGFTTRLGGVSCAPYDGLNMALHVGDDPVKVRKNRQLICAALGIKAEDLVAGEQVHGSEVAVVSEEHRGRGALRYDSALPATDALITNVPGIPLSSYYADCVPILLYDPVKTCVGLAHAGWRGTVQEIAGKTVAHMTEVYGSKPADILAGIGPSIGPCCYQVDLPVQQAFAKSFSYWQELLIPAGENRWMLDLWETNRKILLTAGIQASHITVAKICTCCQNKELFSYRADQGKTGRMASLIMIYPEGGV